MKSLNLLIKPSSSNCNLRCKYCFYHDVSTNRTIENYGMMKDEVLEEMIKKVFECVEQSVNFMFQGGEPTLIGYKFYNTFHELIKKYNKNNITTNFSIQTNGTLLNKNLLEILKKYNYLVGISLDGNKEIHDNFRIDANNNGTFNSVMKGIRLLKKYDIDFNILCVVNKATAKNGKLIYNFFRNNNFKYFQFIPCIDNFKYSETEDYTLIPEDYGIFLNDIFELWYEDIKKGKYVSIRYFDNLIKILLGEQPESCDMMGICSINCIIESDGSVYPCDFYVLDKYKLGNILNSSYENMIFSNIAKEFVEASIEKPNSCKLCKYLKLCRSGCRRHKENNNLENKFCKSYKIFFDKNINKLLEIANIVIKARQY